jgi:hypothetical protein
VEPVDEILYRVEVKKYSIPKHRVRIGTKYRAKCIVRANPGNIEKIERLDVWATDVTQEFLNPS